MQSIYFSFSGKTVQNCLFRRRTDWKRDVKNYYELFKHSRCLMTVLYFYKTEYCIYELCIYVYEENFYPWCENLPHLGKNISCAPTDIPELRHANFFWRPVKKLQNLFERKKNFEISERLSLMFINCVMFIFLLYIALNYYRANHLFTFFSLMFIRELHLLKLFSVKMCFVVFLNHFITVFCLYEYLVSEI